MGSDRDYNAVSASVTHAVEDPLIGAVATEVGPLFQVARRGGGNDGVIQVTARGGAPWWLGLEESDGALFHFFSCRTTSGDFGGDRTDLHDILSLLLAVKLAVDGRSAAVFDVPHPVFPELGEIYARHIVPLQPTSYVPTSERGNTLRELAGSVALLGHFMPRAIGMYDHPERGSYGFDGNDLAAWVEGVKTAFGLAWTADSITTWRRNPDWLYFRSVRSLVSAVHAPAVALFLDALIRSAPDPERHDSPHAELLVRGTSRNAIPASTRRRLNKAMRSLEGEVARHIIPLENLVVGVGRDHILAVPAESGRHRHDGERLALSVRLRTDAAFLRQDATFRWASPVDAGRFEELVLELLQNDPGVRARASGHVNDRDQGRDLIIERMAVPTSNTADLDSPLARVRIVGQCKVRQGGVRKADVVDISDTMTRHHAVGFFLAVSTYLTNDLSAWLDDRRRSGHFDWWTRTEIENRLREEPGVLSRFSDIVTMVSA